MRIRDFFIEAPPRAKARKRRSWRFVTAGGGSTYSLSTSLASVAAALDAMSNSAAASGSLGSSTSVSGSPSNVSTAAESLGISAAVSPAFVNVIANATALAVTSSMQQSAAHVLASAVLNAVDTSVSESNVNVIGVSQSLAAACGDSDLLGLVRGLSVTLAEVSSLDANIIKAFVVATSLDVRASIDEFAQLSAALATELRSEAGGVEQARLVIQTALTLGVVAILEALARIPGIRIDLVKLILDEWTRADIIDEEIDPGQRI